MSLPERRPMMNQASLAGAVGAASRPVSSLECPELVGGQPLAEQGLVEHLPG